MTTEVLIDRKTGLEQAVGNLGAPDIAKKLEALERMDPISAGIMMRRVDPKRINAADERAVLFGNVD